MRIVALQLDVVWEDKAANFGRVRAMIEASPPPAGSLVVLPEMFATGFSLNLEATAEPEDGETSRFLAGISREWKVYTLGGVTTRTVGGRGLNQAIAFAPDGREVCRYSKVHPFTFGREHERIDAGGDACVFEWGGFVVAPMVCYDLRFPELFRRAVKRGATLFAVIANWPRPREMHWTTLLAARAIENQAYVVGVNRCGSDPTLAYPGLSRVIDPQGRVVAEVGEPAAALAQDIDPSQVAEYRASFPALRDMHV